MCSDTEISGGPLSEMTTYQELALELTEKQKSSCFLLMNTKSVSRTITALLRQLSR